jgi:hypothetical protein
MGLTTFLGTDFDGCRIAIAEGPEPQVAIGEVRAFGLCRAESDGWATIFYTFWQPPTG